LNIINSTSLLATLYCRSKWDIHFLTVFPEVVRYQDADINSICTNHSNDYFSHLGIISYLGLPNSVNFGVVHYHPLSLDHHEQDRVLQLLSDRVITLEKALLQNLGGQPNHCLIYNNALDASKADFFQQSEYCFL
jgi:hypothetical protein